MCEIVASILRSDMRCFCAHTCTRRSCTSSDRSHRFYYVRGITLVPLSTRLDGSRKADAATGELNRRRLIGLVRDGTERDPARIQAYVRPG